VPRGTNTDAVLFPSLNSTTPTLLPSSSCTCRPIADDVNPLVYVIHVKQAKVLHFHLYFQCNQHYHHHLWLAPLIVRCATHSKQPPERSVLSHAASAWWGFTTADDRSGWKQSFVEVSIPVSAHSRARSANTRCSRPAAHSARRPDVRDRRQTDVKGQTDIRQTASSLNAAEPAPL